MGVYSPLSWAYTTMTEDVALGSGMCNCFAIRAAARHVTQFYDHFLAQSGLRTTPFSILARLKRGASVMINSLARAMVMDRTPFGRNILPLERDGLIRLEAAASDRRAKVLHLTRLGEQRLKRARHAWTKAQDCFEGDLGPGRA